jgi:membrane associated rhomboid family serine protease
LSPVAYASCMTAVSPAPSRSPVAEDRIRGVIFVAAMVVVMWALEVVDLIGGNLDSDGIHPRDVDGLPGIAFAPFLHAGWGHLIGNTVPFLVLGFTIALGGLLRTAAVTGIVALVAGFGTWLLGPGNTNHIGASGLVFGFAAYLVARGVFSHRALHIGVGLAVLAVYGSTLALGFVPTPGVSWQGHLFGAVGGVIAARVLHASTRRPSPAAS